MKCLLAVFALTVFALPSRGAPPDPNPSQTLYSNVTLIDGTGSAPRAGIDILVSGEHIAQVVPHGSWPADQAAPWREVDLGGRFVIPGLIDSHVHIATPPDRRQALAVLRRNLYGGVTAVRDMGDDMRAVAELAREARFAEIASPDIHYAALLAGPSFFADPRVAEASRGFAAGTAPWMQSIGGSTDLPSAIAVARGTAAAGVKVYADLSGPQVSAIAAEAHRQKLRVWAHSAVFPASPLEVIESGADSVSHVCYLGFQRHERMPATYGARTLVDEGLFTAWPDPVLDGLFNAMKARGTVLDATGSVFVQHDRARRANPALRPLRCSEAFVTAATRQAWRAGVRISAGTDSTGSASHQWPEVHEEMFFLAVNVGMPALEVIRSATLVGAIAAGRGADMGTVAAGKLANFVVLAKSPLDSIANVQSVVMTVKRGKAYRRDEYEGVTVREIPDDGP